MARLDSLENHLRSSFDDYFRNGNENVRQAIRDQLNRYIADTRQLCVEGGEDRFEQLPYVLLDVDVWLEDTTTGDLERYVVVGPDESNAESGQISCLSPLGLALMQKEVGATVIWEAPGGDFAYRVVAIGHAPHSP